MLASSCCCFCFLEKKMQHQNILDRAVDLEEIWDGSTMSGISILNNGSRSEDNNSGLYSSS